MSTDLDTTRIVRSWLRQDEHESAARVLDEVLAALDATPQRPPWWPARRIADMNTYAKFAIAAAAVVVVAVVGYNLLPARGGLGGGPAATPAPSPTASLGPSASPAGFPPAGELAVADRHSMTLEGVPFSFSVPTADWVSNGVYGIDKSGGVNPDGAAFIFWNDAPVGVFSDPCNSVKAPPVGTSAADLAEAVTTVPGLDVVSGPSDVTVGGHPAKFVVVTVREDIDCRPNSLYLWYAPQEDQARYATEFGSTIRVWIIDVDGSIVWIDGETYKGAGPEPAQEVQQIIESIQFE